MGKNRRYGRELAENVRDRQSEPDAERLREQPRARTENRQQPDAGDETHALAEHRKEDGRARMPDGLEIGRGDHVDGDCPDHAVRNGKIVRGGRQERLVSALHEE